MCLNRSLSISTPAFCISDYCPVQSSTCHTTVEILLKFGTRAIASIYRDFYIFYLFKHYLFDNIMVSNIDASLSDSRMT